MAALSALLKTWVILQTLCLALAQVVSGQGAYRPLFCGSVWFRASGKSWCDVKGCLGAGGSHLNAAGWCSKGLSVVIILLCSMHVKERAWNEFFCCGEKMKPDYLLWIIILIVSGLLSRLKIRLRRYCWRQGYAITWAPFFGLGVFFPLKFGEKRWRLFLFFMAVAKMDTSGHWHTLALLTERDSPYANRHLCEISSTSFKDYSDFVLTFLSWRIGF